jgi:WD40 repeat protein
VSSDLGENDAGPLQARAGVGGGYSVDARGGMGVQVGEGNTQIIYTYNRLTWTDGVAPPPLVSVSGAVDSPYRGLSAFEEQDAAFFFGREAVATEVLDRMSRLFPGAGLMVVSGVSGAGKSSLLRAGVLPRIRGAGLASAPGAIAWPCLVFTPGRAPLDELALRVAVLAGADAAAARRGLDRDPSGFALTARQAAFAPPPGARRDQEASGDGRHQSQQQRRLLLVVDQFEQVFTQCADEGEREAFITALCAAAGAGRGTDYAPAALVVLGVRADFEGRCAAYPELAGAVQDRYLVTAMTERQLRMAITEPAKKAGSQVDHDLVEVLLAEVRTRQPGVGGAGVLPLLSHALDQAWRSRTGAALTLADYERTGGIEGAVADSAQRAYDHLTSGQQAAARQVFTRLTGISAEGVDTADRATRAELTEGKSAAEIQDVHAVLEAFAAERLLTLAADSVEISHEVLPAAWPLLRDTWLAETHADRIVRTRLHNVAAEWERHSRDSSYLYSGSLLQAAETVARIGGDTVRHSPLSQTERDFLHASDRAAARRTRRRRALAGVLVILLIASVAGAGIAAAAARNASQQRTAAVSGQLAAESEALDAADPVTASLLAAAAWRIDPAAQASDSMLDVLAQPDHGVLVAGSIFGFGPTAVVFSPDGKILVTVGFDVRLWNLASHRQIGAPFGDAVNGVAFSPDGKTLAVAGDAVRLWDLTTHHQIGSPFGTGGMDAVAFSPDGKTLITDDQDGTVRLWDVATHTQIGAQFGTKVEAMALSPDGKELVTAGHDGKARLWDLATRHQIGAPLIIGPRAPTPGPIGQTVAFSPDGKTLATASNLGTARLWDLATHTQIGRSLGGNEGVDSLAFSPDGKTLAIASGGSSTSATLWDLATRTQIGVPLGNSVGAMAFSPDGQTLATVNGDGTVRLWDLTAHNQIGGPVSSRTGGVTAVAFSPDGKTLATAGEDGKARLWDVASRTQIGAAVGRDEYAVAFSIDGQTLATAGYDGKVRLWSVAAAHHQIGTPFGSGVSAVAFDPDGKTLATWGASGSARLWDLATRTPIGAPIPSGYPGAVPGSVNAVAFSADGKTLATAGYDGKVRLWDKVSRRQIGAPLTVGQSGPTGGMAFSPDGKTLATWGSDGLARLWDVATHAQIGAPLGGNGGVFAVAFSPDGKTLATVGRDGTARLWDLTTHAQIGTPLGTGRVNAVAFSPDGKTLAISSSAGAVQMWNIAFPNDILKAVCTIAGRSLSRQEWNNYIPSEPFRHTCP